MRALSWFIIRIFYEYLYRYPTSSNINIFWNFGVLSGLCLVIQIITGLFMSMHYIATTADAMSSIESMMRNINYGWLVRYAHSNGASAFFISVYIHMFRSFYYGTYSRPNEYVWYVGALIYFCLMATAFLGYVLPWGQMSYWGATVISNLITVIPVVGKDILYVIWGGGTLCDSTIQRFYTFHFVLPFLILGLAMLHIYLLHKAGSRHPVSYDNRSANKIAFFPYFVAKDSMVIIAFFMGYVYLVLLKPNLLGHPDNYIDANPCVTPTHIVPEWYFLSMYAILRCIPDKLIGIVAMFLFISFMFIIPFSSQHVVGNYRLSVNRYTYWLCVTQVLCLTYLGTKLPIYPFDMLSRVCMIMIVLIITNMDLVILKILRKLEKINSYNIDKMNASGSSIRKHEIGAVYNMYIFYYYIKSPYRYRHMRKRSRLLKVVRLKKIRVLKKRFY